jgi:hypothetical protein
MTDRVLLATDSLVCAQTTIDLVLLVPVETDPRIGSIHQKSGDSYAVALSLDFPIEPKFGPPSSKAPHLVT